jgi:hypothetical protein
MCYLGVGTHTKQPFSAPSGADHQPLKSLPAGSSSPGQDVARALARVRRDSGSISDAVPLGLARGWDRRTAKDS